MRTGSVIRRCTRFGCPLAGGYKRKDLSEVRRPHIHVVVHRRSKPSWFGTKAAPGGGFATKAAAVEAMNRLQASVVDGTYVERSRLTLGQYLEEWLAACRNIRPNTARDYSVSIHKHIYPRLGNLRLQAVDRLQIRGLYRKLAESGLGEKPVHNVHICLSKALHDALDDGLLRGNPAERTHRQTEGSAGDEDVVC